MLSGSSPCSECIRPFVICFAIGEPHLFSARVNACCLVDAVRSVSFVSVRRWSIALCCLRNVARLASLVHARRMLCNVYRSRVNGTRCGFIIFAVFCMTHFCRCVSVDYFTFATVESASSFAVTVFLLYSRCCHLLRTLLATSFIV